MVIKEGVKALLFSCSRKKEAVFVNSRSRGKSLETRAQSLFQAFYLEVMHFARIQFLTIGKEQTNERLLTGDDTRLFNQHRAHRKKCE